MNFPCYARCGLDTDTDMRPWLLITGWRFRKIPVAVLVCPDCEASTEYLAGQLHDLIGVRLDDNTADTTIRTALDGWHSLPAAM